ncbi:MAG: DUF4411 family protein [Archaeoglobaceae archaeon]
MHRSSLNNTKQLDLEGSEFKIYIIDSSSLINLKIWYPFEKRFFSPIWAKLENLIKFNSLISHYEVYRELSKRDDNLRDWCNTNSKMFKDEYDMTVLKQVEKKYDKNYWDKNTNSDKPWADPWIIVLAIKKNGVIVTDENRDLNKIPKVAENFGIKSISSPEFIDRIIP